MHKVYNSKIGRYKIYDKNGQKYLIDAKYSSPILSLFVPPHSRTLRAYLFSNNSISVFEKNGESVSLGTLTGVLITQPIVTFLYKLGQNYFNNFSEQNYFLIKLILLMITLFSSFSMFALINSLDKIKFNKIKKNQEITEFDLNIGLPENRTSNNIKHMKNYTRDMIFTITVVLSIPLYLFFKGSDGSESIMLVIISVLTFAILVMVRYAIQSSYEEGQFTFKEKKSIV